LYIYLLFCFIVSCVGTKHEQREVYPRDSILIRSGPPEVKKGEMPLLRICKPKFGRHNGASHKSQEERLVKMPKMQPN